MSVEPPPTERDPRPAGGRRERKKRQTRDTIQREAIRLFLEQGFDATTIDQIADAADVAPSTVFHHFATKEDLIVQDEFDPLVAGILRRQPLGVPLAEAMRGAINDALAEIRGPALEFVLTRARLGFSIPSVRARWWTEMERTEIWWRNAIAEWADLDPDDFELRVAVGVLMTAMATAAMEWMETDGASDLGDLVGRALDIVEAGGAIRMLEGTERGAGPA
ncbi:MAG TPA: TetR family transcriptional regulator [Candidatus Dormibacteraeota bacterium]|jgi:AcrR family transcriptional regulator|nr:TetR family transcriptional regulator [Candidatus Dormibacteraeota bacterium]